MDLFRVTLAGVNLDVDPVELNGKAYQQLNNMVPKPGAMYRAPGYQAQWGTPILDPLYLSYTPQLAGKYWVYAGALGIATVDDGWTHQDITPASLTTTVPPGGWSGGNLNGVAVLNSEENGPYYWNSGLPLAVELPGQRTGTRYRIMRPHKYHLIGMGVVSGTGSFLDELHWSDAADPGQVPSTWEPAADNEAGDTILADETGAIIDGAPLRDSFFVYKQDSIYELSYVGGNEVYRITKVFSSVGALSINCVVEVQGSHVVLGSNDIYQHDGQNIRSLLDGRLKRTFYNIIDQVNFRKSFVAYLESDDQVWFCVPTAGSEWPNLALVWDVASDQFGYRDLPPCSLIAKGIVGPPVVGVVEEWDDDAGQWNSDTTTWLQDSIDSTDDSLVIADPVGTAFYLANTGTLANGAEYDSAVYVEGIDLGDPSSLKSVRRITPRMNAPLTQSFTMSVYGQQAPYQGVGLSYVGTFTPTPDGVPVVVNTRYLAIRLETEGQQEWTISGFDIEYEKRGRF